MKAVRSFLCMALICSVAALGCGKSEVEAPSKEKFKPVDNASAKEAAEPAKVPPPPQ